MSDVDLFTPELEVLRSVAAWAAQGRRVWLATVVETYGSAPRPVGSMAAVNDFGQVAGSVSGGCIEDDLTDWLIRDAKACITGQLLIYGRTADEQVRLRLPCNGHLSIWLEPAPISLLQSLLEAVEAGISMRRTLDLQSGISSLRVATSDECSARLGSVFLHVMGPVARALLIGASEVPRYLAPLMKSLGFQVTVIDPRREYLNTWPYPGYSLVCDMPDDAVLAARPDQRTAVIALSHDPKLDDLALMEALRFPCFYVGAMGSARTTAARKKRLAQFDVSDEQLDRLRGPVGLDIGARTPPEIAISVAADIVKVTRMTRLAEQRATACL